MSNLLSKIEPHAARLEDAADRLDAAGIGGHPKRGHAAVLRDMAGCMRAEAAQGKMPHIYEGSSLYAAADIRAGLAQIGAIDAAEQNSTRLNSMQVEAVGALRRVGLELDDTGTITLHVLNRALAGKPIDQRMRLKSLCANAGILLEG
jgi:hypothetical protein